MLPRHNNPQAHTLRYLLLILLLLRKAFFFFPKENKTPCIHSSTFSISTLILFFTYLVGKTGFPGTFFFLMKLNLVGQTA